MMRIATFLFGGDARSRLIGFSTVLGLAVLCMPVAGWSQEAPAASPKPTVATAPAAAGSGSAGTTNVLDFEQRLRAVEAKRVHRAPGIPAVKFARLEANVDKQQEQSRMLWVLVAAALVFFMQAGFLCLEVGFVQPHNVFITLSKNLVDWCVASLVFCGVSFGIMFGHSNGVIGIDLFSLKGMNVDGANSLGWVFVLFQLGFVGCAITIVSGALAERISFASYLWCSFFIALVLYPVFGHWVWGNGYFASNTPWLAEKGFIDFAGSTVVHSVGGWISLIGVWMVGPRLGRFAADGTPQDLKVYNMPLVALGALVLWVGWWGFNGGSAMELSDVVGKVIINTNIAGTAAGISGFFYAYYFQERRAVLEKFVGALLGGLVAATASSHIISPTGAAVIGFAAGIIHNIAFEKLLDWQLDDPVGAIPVHLACGVWGTLCVGLFGDLDAFGGRTRVDQLGIQIYGIIVCAIWCSVVSYGLFKMLHRTTGLRVSALAESEGVHIEGNIEQDEQGMNEAEIREMMG
jgi:Amt family ammonium transporter